MGNIVYDFLTQPNFRFWRHVLYISVLSPIALAQAFFALGSKEGMTPTLIYQFGFGFMVLLLALAYFCRYVLTRRFLLRDRYIVFLSIIWCSVFILVGIKYLMEAVLSGQNAVINGITLLDWASNGTLYSICIASSSTPFLLRRWSQDQERIDDLEKERFAFDLEDYKNRLNPQLIQTSIRYAARRVSDSPGQVSIFLQKLSNTLRYQLYDYQREKVLLKSEIQFLQNVICLREQVADLNFDGDIHAEGDLHCFIPPGLLLPLVEPVLEESGVKLSVYINTATVDQLTIQIVTDRIDLRNCNLTHLERRLRFLELSYRLSRTSTSIFLQLC